MTYEKLKLEIHKSKNYYHIYLNGGRLRMCEGYKELAMCIGSIIKGTFKKKADEEGYI